MDLRAARQKTRHQLDKAYEAVARHAPERLLKFLQRLRAPEARWARLGTGLAFIVLGVLGPILPVAGLWMIPVGLLLIAEDIPPMQGPMVRHVLWLEAKWLRLRAWWRRRFPRA